MASLIATDVPTDDSEDESCAKAEISDAEFLTVRLWQLSKIANLSAFLVRLHGKAYQFSALCRRSSNSC